MGNVDNDLHLYDSGEVGITTIKKLASLTEEAGWKNRVSISHAFALGDLEGKEAEEMAQMLSELGITITSSIPLGRVIPPVTFLHDRNVAVA